MLDKKDCLQSTALVAALCGGQGAMASSKSGKAPEIITYNALTIWKDAFLPDLYEASIAQLLHGLNKGHFSSVDLVKAYLARIDEVNLKGAALHAVIETNPQALAQAAASDLERKTTASHKLPPLQGIPILVKDNIATLYEEGMNTTAGSFALLGSVVPGDAPVAARLRSAGAIILGKTSPSEWANFRGIVPNGWSGRGGQATCPYYPLGDPSGSSSGSGIASAIGLAAASLGTETDGSIVSPGSRNNLVGIKPTVGLTPRSGVIPISSHQDTVGPMTRSVTDAALLLSIIAGPDPSDNATLAQPVPLPDYLKALSHEALRGVRIGVPRKFVSVGTDPNIIAAFNASIEVIRSLGAVVIDPADYPDADELLASGNETIVLNTDFKVDINSYIAGLVKVPTGVTNLADLITFNEQHASEELIPPYYADQSQFIASEATIVNDTYYAALAADLDLGRVRGIDGVLKEFNLDALFQPTDGFTSTPAAIAGYPIVTVPLGFQPDSVNATPATPIVANAPGLPFGVAFTGTAWSEFKLISYAYAYEQATHNRLKRLAYPAAIPTTQLWDVIGK